MKTKDIKSNFQLLQKNKYKQYQTLPIAGCQTAQTIDQAINQQMQKTGASTQKISDRDR